jgi:pyridoxal phosphate enzyme (YggS family)
MEKLKESINKNIDDVYKEIKNIVTDKKLKDAVLLIAVTKTRTVEEINFAIEHGITDIGENKVQEIIDKYDKVGKVRWHMIGHLQTNKVKYIIDKVSMIHSVDSYKLAEEINKRAEQHGLCMEILIQINPANEESKFGINPEETISLINNITNDFNNIKVKGLMTIAPYSDDPEEVRKYFKNIHEIYSNILNNLDIGKNFQYLSMGMSNDFRVAIEEGSNMVRIGSLLFGERNYL